MIPDSRQTIIAPATPSGEGGVAVVRLSGNMAEPALLRFFHPTKASSGLVSHRLYHGHLRRNADEMVDEVLAVVMRAPHSFTREDVVEIHCHGGPIIIRRILDLFLENPDIRLAQPGEFTLRAFLNGRIDLAQAEAVGDIIRSRSEAACNVAMQQLGGRLSRTIRELRVEVADLLAFVETHVDFQEEDIDFPAPERLKEAGTELVKRIEGLLATFEDGRALREGVEVLILGRPNVGKSSLLNALLGEARAIVTDISGTTRDTIEETLSLGGLPLRLIDTAGVRDTADPVETEGVRRAKERVASADLVLLVVDGSTETCKEDLMALTACKDARLLLVLSKKDLPVVPIVEPFFSLPSIRVSTHTGEGLAELKEGIRNLFLKHPSPEGRESVLLSDRRHREALVRGREALVRFCDNARKCNFFELLAVDLRDALQALGEITGETTPNDILERIFSRFCIGK